MNIVPLVSLKKGKLLDGKDGEPVSLDTLFSQVEKDSFLYVLDYDGVEHNNPNLELYQRLTEHCILWIDDGPRRLDDVMDTIMSGATNLTLRKELWPDLDLPGVQELTDDEIYIEINNKTLQHSFAEDIGLVLFNDENTYGTFSPDRAAKQKIYLYVASTERIQFWEQQGIAGIIIDLNKKQGAQ